MTRNIFYTNDMLNKSIFYPVFLLCIFLCMAFPKKILANSLIRDAEIENTLQMIAMPVFTAAKIKDTNIKVFLINSDDVNAFIVDNNRVFFTTGLMMKLETLEMFQSILAHEVAHITLGHLFRKKVNLTNIQRQSNLGSILGIVIASTLDANTGMAITVGANTTAQNEYLSNSREMETTADSIGVNLLYKAKIDPSNSIKTMKLFDNLERLTSFNENDYLRTHPPSKKRIQNIKYIIKELNPQEYTQDEYQKYRYQRILTKIKAFTKEPRITLREINKETDDEISLIKTAIASHLKPEPATALAATKKLMSLRPNDPFFIELLGQIYLEIGQPRKAIDAFSRASAIMPDEPIFLIWNAMAHLALNESENNVIALKILQSANKLDSMNPRLLRNLSIAYARNNQHGKAALKASEHSFIIGQFKAAKMHAKKASKTLIPYSIEWRKAQDIIKITSKLGEKN